MFKPRLLIAATAAAAIFASAAQAERGSDGQLNILYWQAPSILNPYLSGGTKDIDASSLIVEPLAHYDENGNIVPALVTEVPTVANGGISSDLNHHHLEAGARNRLVRWHALHLGRRGFLGGLLHASRRWRLQRQPQFHRCGLGRGPRRADRQDHLRRSQALSLWPLRWPRPRR